MIIYPAIDLKNGQCVRLKQGEMNTATVFSDDPVKQALEFEKMGFKWLHIVDLDGAFAGKSINDKVVASIAKNVRIPIQLGGGIRNIESMEFWLEKGVTKLILGTIALKNPAIVFEACKKFPGRIVVGIDAKDGNVATEGWAEISEITAIELAKRYENDGVSAIIFTDINRDGLLCGVNIEATQELAKSINIPVIASGGVGSIDDIKKLKAIEKDGIQGVIVGRALYDGRINVAEILENV